LTYEKLPIDFLSKKSWINKPYFKPHSPLVTL
jgi:hypothetical protein